MGVVVGGVVDDERRDEKVPIACIIRVVIADHDVKLAVLELVFVIDCLGLICRMR